MKSDRPFPKVYEVVPGPPQVGEKLYFVGYDWRNRKNAFAERVYEVTVLRVLGVSLILDKAGAEGSSSSCLVNTKGQAVAVNAWGPKMDSQEEVGVAIGIWGEWNPLFVAAKKQ